MDLNDPKRRENFIGLSDKAKGKAIRKLEKQRAKEDAEIRLVKGYAPSRPGL